MHLWFYYHHKVKELVVLSCNNRIIETWMIGYPRISSLGRIQDLHLKMAHRLDQRTTTNNNKKANKNQKQTKASVDRWEVVFF